MINLYTTRKCWKLIWQLSYMDNEVNLGFYTTTRKCWKLMENGNYLI